MILQPEERAPALISSYRDSWDGATIYRPDGRARWLTPRECARLMGFPDEYQICGTDHQFYRQIGNSGRCSFSKGNYGGAFKSRPGRRGQAPRAACRLRAGRGSSPE